MSSKNLNILKLGTYKYMNYCVCIQMNYNQEKGFTIFMRRSLFCEGKKYEKISENHLSLQRQ